MRLAQAAIAPSLAFRGVRTWPTSSGASVSNSSVLTAQHLRDLLLLVLAASGAALRLLLALEHEVTHPFSAATGWAGAVSLPLLREVLIALIFLGLQR